jgi:hypothetical protein
MGKFCPDCGKEVCPECGYCKKCKRKSGKPKGILDKILDG